MHAKFEAMHHIQSVPTGVPVPMLTTDGVPLPKILGVCGVSEILESGNLIGADRIIRWHDFLREHDVDYGMSAGDTAYVPARLHTASRRTRTPTSPTRSSPFGVPHADRLGRMDGPDHTTSTTRVHGGRPWPLARISHQRATSGRATVESTGARHVRR